MTGRRMTDSWRTRLAAGAAVAGLAAAVAGCGSDSSGSGGHALDVSGLMKLADGVHAKPTTTCPVRYDIAAAAKAAGISGKAAPTTGTDAVVADTQAGADSDSVLVTSNGAILTCTYQVGTETVAVATVATHKEGAALPMMLPLIQRDASMASSAARTFFDSAHKADVGTATSTPSGNVAVVRLKAKDSGDVELTVTAGQDGHSSLDAAAVRHLAEQLAAQADW
ncbi:MAG TPA: hypothetical protein VGL02_27770 [Streptomyces sp.]